MQLPHPDSRTSVWSWFPPELDLPWRSSSVMGCRRAAAFLLTDLTSLHSHDEATERGKDALLTSL